MKEKNWKFSTHFVKNNVISMFRILNETFLLNLKLMAVCVYGRRGDKWKHEKVY